MEINRWAAHALLGASLSFLGACSGGDGIAVENDVAAQSGAQEACVVQAPQIVEIREENPGPVAAGVTKIYHVTARNQNSAGCAPATLSFVPDAFMFFAISPQPTSIAGVASGATASFRVAVSSDPSVPEGVNLLGFTLVSTTPNAASTTTRGELRYEIDFDNPTGCNRQLPQVEVQPSSPPPVAAGTTVEYEVTVRNVDNRECGPDTFSLGFDFFRFFTIVPSGPITIPAGGSGTFDVSVTSEPFLGPGVRELGFNVFGQRHVNAGLIGRGALRYEIQ